MSLRRSIFAALAATLGTAGFAAAAAPGPWSLAPGEYYTELSGSFFSAGSFYADNGDRTLAGGLYEQRAIHTVTELGWKKNVSVQLELPFLSRTIRQGYAATATNTGLGDLGIGFRYALVKGPNAAALQARWETPAGYNAALVPQVGDGMQKLTAALALGRPLGQAGFVQAGGGYRWEFRTIGARESANGSLSSKSDWEDHALANGAIAFWLGRLQLAGVYDAAFSAATGRDIETSWQLAGPRVTYRVDGHVDAFAGSWHSPTGKNVLHLDQFYAGIAWKQTKLNRLQGFIGGDSKP